MIPCVPLNSLWHGQYDKCQDFTALVLGLSGISLVDDFILLLAPLPILLQITRTHFRKNKMALWFLAFLGVLVFLGDCVQITYSKGYMLTQTSDPAGSHAKKIQATLWFVFRNNVIFVVACLPQARATTSHLLSLLRARSSSPDLEVPATRSEVAEKLPVTEHTQELDRVFEMFKHNYDSHKLSRVSTALTAAPEQVNSPHTTSQEFVSTESRQDSLSNFDDRAQWLNPTSMPQALTTHGLLPATTPFNTESPFEGRRKEWEEIYPAEAVNILNFDEQFKISAQQGNKDNISGYGRSTLQKQYFDKVTRLREQMRGREEAGRGIRQASDTLPPVPDAERSRNQSTTLPAEDMTVMTHETPLEEAPEDSQIYLF